MLLWAYRTRIVLISLILSLFRLALRILTWTLWTLVALFPGTSQATCLTSLPSRGVAARIQGNMFGTVLTSKVQSDDRFDITR